jgi:hypothetical protein
VVCVAIVSREPAAFIYPRKCPPDLVVVVVYNRQPLNEHPAFGA